MFQEKSCQAMHRVRHTTQFEDTYNMDIHLLCVMKYLQHIHEICVYITYINMKFVDSCNGQQVGMLACQR